MSRFHNRTILRIFIALGITTCLPLMGQGQLKTPSRVLSGEAPHQVTQVELVNKTTVKVKNERGIITLLDFYGENIVRFFSDKNSTTMRPPEAKPPAQILVDKPRRNVQALKIVKNDREISISSSYISIIIDKRTGMFRVRNIKTGKAVVEQISPLTASTGAISIGFSEQPDEYFYGGGVQNGRFSYKGKIIAIENQNSWTDGGVASPTPFFWSTRGYGILFNTFAKGKYDFGAQSVGKVLLSHASPYLDMFLMVNEDPLGILNDFYQLTGKPVLLPKFAFYEGHLNAYNRDFWKEDPKGTLFEDGKRYKESQKDNGGVKESLNGEKNNYLFSARAVIDRYKKHDMPLGWILPNDGYGAGYGQTQTLTGNIANLKNFGDYARRNGVEIGLWTQSDLHPKAGVSALLQRDIVREVQTAGVRVLKTDVAWVGAGYSFGLNGVADVGKIMPKYGNDARPFIISLDGWAGTQRYASIWTGDQTGGEWEYIRFHIPTYIGSGLSGQPNITSDMDGIFGGRNAAVNIRDFQWKTFTPMQLNMDGWGANEKYPHALGEPAASINRNYLKLKSELLPYSYSIAHEAISGAPIIRPMFLATQNAYTLGTATQYQYLYGPSFLVAPVYKATKADTLGNDIRNNIYLPAGKWIDYFSGEVYEGNRVINNIDVPIWKIPVFVRASSIIPMANPNNNIHQIDNTLRTYEIYADGHNSFTEYDDDGSTEAYKTGANTKTLISTDVKGNVLSIKVNPTKGSFEGFQKMKKTIIRVNVSQPPQKVALLQGGKRAMLKMLSTISDFDKATSGWFYDPQPNLNRFATAGSEFSKQRITKNPQLLIKVANTDVSRNSVELNISGFSFNANPSYLKGQGTLKAPSGRVTENNVHPFSLLPSWSAVDNADFYEIQFNGMLYSTIRDTTLLFEDLQPEQDYSFKIRAVNKSGHSTWTDFDTRTAANPLRFAIKGIQATSSAKDQEGSEIEQLLNHNTTDGWHSNWNVKAVPFDITLDLRSVNELDKIEYLPRAGGGNGNWLKGSVALSNDKKTWTPAGDFTWPRNDVKKDFIFTSHPVARYIKIHVDLAVGDFGSGRELFVFKVPGSSSYLPGDINNDKKIDNNDLTSYMNYTGLRSGDADFDGYISVGDVNKNGLIDAVDISNVATQLEGGVSKVQKQPLQGRIAVTASKSSYNTGEMIELQVKADDLRSVNAFSFALPYNAEDMEYQGIDAKNMGDMENLTYDRLHSNGTKCLYPTFINIGNKRSVDGSSELFIIKFKAKRKLSLKPLISDGLLVDKELNTLTF